MAGRFLLLMRDPDKPKPEELASSIGQWIPLGIAFGVVLGVIFDGLLIGIAIGLAAGVAFGAARARR
ncbi:MAG: hypothetical protein WAO61_04625 [Solirubrobacterales bacterium]